MKGLIFATAIMAILSSCANDISDWIRLNEPVANWAGHGVGSMEYEYLNLISSDRGECGDRWFKQQPSIEFPKMLSRFSDGLRQGKFYSIDILSEIRILWQEYRVAWEIHLRSLEHDRAACRELIRMHWETCNATAAKINSLEYIFLEFYRTHKSASTHEITATEFFGKQ